MVRRFARQEVAADVLARILDVARHAPSAGFTQAFRLVVLEDPERLDWFWRVTTPAADQGELDRLFESAPPVIALPFVAKAAYLARYSEADKAAFGLGDEAAWPVPFWHVDAGMAIMLILLAAVDEGLGGWYFGIVQGQAELIRELGVPDDYTLVGCIGLGYPASDDVPSGSARTRRRISYEESVHYRGW
jgi:nitroreductase